MREKMVRRVLAVGMITALSATSAWAQEAPQGGDAPYNCDFNPSCEVAPGIYGKISAPVTSKFKMSLGGYVKLDYIYNSVSLGTANGVGTVATLQPNGIPKSSSPAGKQDQSLFNARQSRLWFKTEGPAFSGAKTGALIETDFFGSGGSSAESANMRIRLAYGTLDWANTQFLFGQSWDVFGPASASTIDFGQGQTTGNPTTPRVPQLRVTQKVKLDDRNTLKLIAALQHPTQDSNTANGTAGETWGAKPNVAGQAMWVSKALGVAPGFWGIPMNSLQAGFFGLYGNQEVSGNTHTVDSWGYGFYTFVPVLSSSDGKSRAMTASFEGQVYQAANMAFNYATVAPLVGAVGDKTGAKGYGIFGQAIFYPTQNLGLTAGYGMRGAKDQEAFVASGIKDFQRSSSQIFANAAYDLNAAIRVAAEYQYVSTRYGNVTAGTSDLGKANVFRFSMMYFF
ncbi:hypothetical protein Gbem_3572 [Citrifermentans bemidjiense Bem]|uniref:Porin n=1 Tax=Citrifermentans bemidjiense (strain ATCC BAA-1014 / DSM 16622 / JCM 12645 / Bem) TaxID=404380 RepID=B5ECU7_CITBB|nr:hypothetical protein [Citrifermentans bemidjiense]ACH40564.1 hypothetical protein Gbem_3572 [Citrifermentans bemidjiense Bem]